MLDCKHASRLVSQSMDRRLSLRERLGLRLHLLICDACTQFSKQMALLQQAARQWRSRIEDDTRVSLPDDARQRIAAAVALKAESQARQNPDQNLTD